MLFSNKIRNLPVFATRRQVLVTCFGVSSNVNGLHVCVWDREWAPPLVYYLPCAVCCALRAMQVAAPPNLFFVL